MLEPNEEINSISNVSEEKEKVRRQKRKKQEIHHLGLLPES